MATQRALVKAEPQSVEEARRAVAETRGRMSDTLDAIEDRLVSKKQEWTDRIDVMRPVKQRVRSRPWPALAIAFGFGVIVWKLRQRERHEIEKPKPGKLQRLLHRI